MKLNKPLVVFDIEATGLEIGKDRIVTMTLAKFTGELNVNSKASEIRTFYCNPGIPINPEATEVHGLTDADVSGWLQFSEYSKAVFAFITGCDLAGYNLLNFDVPMLWDELNRCGINWDLKGVNILDAGNIFKKKEPRDLSAAVKFYCFREHTSAHDSKADTISTADVLAAQIACYDDLEKMSVEDLSVFCKMEDRLDLQGIIVRNKNGEPVFNTKRNRGVRVVDDIGYANWMLRSDFPTQTKLVIERILSEEQ